MNAPFYSLAVVCALCLNLSARDKFLGAIWKSGWDSPSDAPAVFDSLFDQVTPENNGKWGVAEEERGQFRWKELDAMYDYAQQHNMLVKHHTFVWGSQQPSWITGISDDAEVRSAVEGWIRTYMDRFGSRVDMIDVVNEPLHQKPAYRGSLGGDGATGWDWVIWCFEKAREYAPHARLHINDYDILKSDKNTKNYLKIITLLKQRGLIDGIGVQGHFLENTSVEKIRSNLNRLAESELPIHVSEYDVNVADDRRQKQVYEEQLPVFWEQNAVVGVTLWGFRQGKMWRGNGYLVRSDGTWRPALEWLYDYVYGDETQIRGTRETAAISVPSRVSGNRIIVPHPWKKKASTVPSFRIDGKKTLPGIMATQCLVPVPVEE